MVEGRGSNTHPTALRTSSLTAIAKSPFVNTDKDVFIANLAEGFLGQLTDANTPYDKYNRFFRPYNIALTPIIKY